MKVLALTTKTPGIRYQAHLWTLQNMPIELVCVEVAGLGIVAEKIKHQLLALKNKGPLRFFKWRRDRDSAAPLRKKMAARLLQLLRDEPFFNFFPHLQHSFKGFTPSLVKFIRAENPDFILQVGVGVIPAHFIEQVPPILNLHPGILPGIRGLDPTFWAHYYARKDWFGATLHIVDAGIDTGKPLLRRRFVPKQNSHFIESVSQQLFLEMELLRIFFSNYPQNYMQYDMGGCEKSVYHSSWSAKQFHALEAVDWWGPITKSNGLNTLKPSIVA